MTTFLIVEAIVVFSLMALIIWWLADFWPLPQNIRCKLGVHDLWIDEVITEKGMGIFGGPVTYYKCHCMNCPYRGY